MLQLLTDKRAHAQAHTRTRTNTHTHMHTHTLTHTYAKFITAHAQCTPKAVLEKKKFSKKGDSDAKFHFNGGGNKFGVKSP